jgi:hypothetical protein
MSTLAVQILAVGPTTLNTLGSLKKWVNSGWSSHSVASLREAETVLKTIRFNVVLAAETLADGTGYDLGPIISRQGGTLYVGVALSETRLWLPVVERGVRSLGERAINSAILESEVVEVLRRVQEGITIAAASAISAQLRIELAAHAGGTRFLAGEAVLDIDSHSLAPGYPRAFDQPVRSNEGGEWGNMTADPTMPPRKKLLAQGAAAGGPPRTLNSGDTDPAAGARGKSWRG